MACIICCNLHSIIIVVFAIRRMICPLSSFKSVPAQRNNDRLPYDLPVDLSRYPCSEGPRESCSRVRRAESSRDPYFTIWPNTAFFPHKHCQLRLWLRTCSRGSLADAIEARHWASSTLTTAVAPESEQMQYDSPPLTEKAFEGFRKPF